MHLTLPLATVLLLLTTLMFLVGLQVTLPEILAGCEHPEDPGNRHQLAECGAVPPDRHQRLFRHGRGRRRHLLFLIGTIANLVYARYLGRGPEREMAEAPGRTS